MYKYHGIAVYEIIDNGRMLSGISTNNTITLITTIRSDIAIKQHGDPLDTIAGKYDTHVMDIENNKEVVVPCGLVITLVGSVYHFVWEDKWKGIGIKAGNNHIAVSYSHAL